MFPDWDMLDDTMPGVTFSCEGISDGAIEDASLEALRATYAQIAEKARK